MAEAPAKEFSAEIKDLADKIVNLSVKDAQSLVDCLKEEHGIEPAVPANPAAALKLAATSKLPKIRQFISRRLAEQKK